MADVSVTLQPGQEYPVSVTDQLTASSATAPLTNINVAVASVSGINATVAGASQQIVTLQSGIAGATPTLSVDSNVVSGTPPQVSLSGPSYTPTLHFTLPSGGSSFNQSLNTTDAATFASVVITGTDTVDGGNPLKSNIKIGNELQGYGTYGLFINGDYNNGQNEGKINLYVDPDAGNAVLDYANTQTLLFPHQIIGGQIYGSGVGSVSGNWVLNADGTASFVNGAVTIDSNGQLTLPDISVALTCKGGAAFGFNGGGSPNFTIDESGNLTQSGYTSASFGLGNTSFGNGSSSINGDGSVSFASGAFQITSTGGLLFGNYIQCNYGIVGNNFNIHDDYNGSASFAAGNFQITSDGTIQNAGASAWSMSSSGDFYLVGAITAPDGIFNFGGGSLTTDGTNLFWNGVQIA